MGPGNDIFDPRLDAVGSFLFLRYALNSGWIRNRDPWAFVYEHMWPVLDGMEREHVHHSSPGDCIWMS